jgi:thiamine kinase
MASPPEIETLCAAIVPGEGAVRIRDLSQGLVNQSYRVSRMGRDYSLRLASADGAAIALDRGWEARLLQAAGDAGLAPALRFSDAARGILLSDWLPGRSWLGVDVGNAANIAPVAALLRRVHALPIPPPAHCMTPAAWLEHYEALGSGALPRRPAATRYLNEWAALAAAPAVVCHGDLHVLNLIQSGESLRLLDWEYAHVSDAYWDLAGWCANGDFSKDARRRLLADYLGNAPSGEQWRRLNLSAWLYDYVCLQWSALYLNRQALLPSAGPAGAAAAAAAAITARAALLDARLSIPAN